MGSEAAVKLFSKKVWFSEWMVVITVCCLLWSMKGGGSEYIQPRTALPKNSCCQQSNFSLQYPPTAAVFQGGGASAIDSACASAGVSSSSSSTLCSAVIGSWCCSIQLSTMIEAAKDHFKCKFTLLETSRGGGKIFWAEIFFKENSGFSSFSIWVRGASGLKSIAWVIKSD